MLNKISPVLGPDLLATLRIMGHGDGIAIVDGNYPAAAHSQRLIRADGIKLIPILDGILDILPIETKTDSIVRAVNAESPKTIEPIHQEIIDICAKYNYAVTALEPEPFYKKVRLAFAVVATSEPALYGNVILTKGVVSPTN